MKRYEFTRRWPIMAALLFGLTSSAVATGQVPTTDAPAVDLFDGKTLSGWEADGNEKYFRVEDGCIVAGTLDEKIPHNYFLCTKKRYDDFELTFEAKLVGEGNNAGVQFRTERIAGETEVSGYQADIGVAWNRSVWGALYDESRRRKMLAEPSAELGKEIVKEDDWNKMRVICKGSSIEIYVNGTQTVDYTETEPSIPRTGVIALQIHSGPPTEAWYRNIKLRSLKD